MSDPPASEQPTTAGALETEPAEPRRSGPAPERIGRHIVIDQLGAGGMGVVYAAYDPELDRRIAIKLIQSDQRGALDPSRARSKLTAEAQAMARLSHPNVIAVYDVGTHGGSVYVAMEHVDGETLRPWMAARHPWQEIVAVFMRAGRGLEAAHERGLVHCDFKPENVLLGQDGRVRVADFGLARAVDPQQITNLPPESAAAITDDAALAATAARTLGPAGTPGYMAPEQFSGATTDARTDQFSFCVALHEALYGERPFAGDTLASLSYAVLEGELRDPPAGIDVPAWLRRVLLRGLAVKPEDRYPSMRALLDDLGHDPARTRRRVMLGAAMVAAIGAAAWGVYASQQARVRLCEGANDNLAGVWDADRKAAARAAFENTGLAFAPGTFGWLERRLDDYAERWTAMHRDACEATHVRGEQSGELLDLRMACLRAQLRDLDALALVFAEADATVVRNAVAAAGSLPTLSVCADGDALRAALPPPEDIATAAAVDSARARLARASALQRSGAHMDGLALARELATTAEALGYAPLLVEAQRRRGLLEEKTGDYGAAQASLMEAYFGALRVGHDRELAEAGAALVMVVGLRQAKHAEGLAWGLHADAAVERIGRGGAEEARLLNNLATVRNAKGDREAALDAQARALEIYESVLEPDDPTVASTLNNLGILLHDAGRDDEALEPLERARQAWETALGVDNPEVAAAYNNIGLVLEEKGQLVDAKRNYERALAIKEAALGPDHPDVSMLLNNLGLLAEKQGNYGLARSRHERALSIKQRTLGAEHPSVAISINNIGGLLNLEGEHAAARERYETALRMFERALGPGHALVAYALTGLGTADVGLGEPGRALEPLERALKLRVDTQAGPFERADTRFMLARALWDSRRDRRRATQLANEALTEFEAAGDAGTEAAGDVRAWLSGHAR